MPRRKKVFIVNKSTHDFSPAEQYGDIVFLTEGIMDRYATNNIFRTFKNAMKDSNIVILANHGLVTVGVDFNDAIQRAVFFELACQILICQKEPKHLTQSQFDKLYKLSDGV